MRLIVVKEDTVRKEDVFPHETDIVHQGQRIFAKLLLTIQFFFVFCFGKMSMEPSILSCASFAVSFMLSFVTEKGEHGAENNFPHRIFRGIVILLDLYYTLSSRICFSLWTTESGGSPPFFLLNDIDPRDGENLIPSFSAASNCIPHQVAAEIIRIKIVMVGRKHRPCFSQFADSQQR